MFQLTVRQKVAALVLMVFLAVGGAILFIGETGGRVVEYRDDIDNNRIYVQIGGAVARPGVISLKAGTRKFEALTKVGGALPEADLNRVNLAEYVEDGEFIYLPRKGEVIETPSKKRSTAKKSGFEAKSKVTAGKTVKNKQQWPLDVNAATMEQLETVPGIGAFLASKIKEYRDKNGRFQSFEDLTKVYGIGPVRLEKLRPYLTVK